MSSGEKQIVIKIKNISKKFSDKKVLRSIDLDIEAGQIVGYIGPNGAGKSTTIKILTGIIKDFEGTAQICGFDVRKNPIEVKKRIGYVPETTNLYDTLSPLEYLMFVGRIYLMEDALIEQRAIDLLGYLGLKDELHNPMTSFSKGMKQRVLIVAGMIHNPEVLFLDEPLSGLDANSVVLVKEIISQLAKSGKSVFYCSHMMDVVEKVCDRIVILSNGVIVADGSFSQLQEIEEDSLETIFSQITNQTDHELVAREFIKALDFEAEI